MKAIRVAAALSSLVLLTLVSCGNQTDVSQIRAVIEKANHEQEDAFAAHDATLMQDTSTAQNFAVMVRANDEIAQEGGVGIRLTRLEWGEVNVTSESSATATTWETWETTLDNGQTLSERQRNVYWLVRIGTQWKINQIDHPDTPTPGAGGVPASAAPGL